MSVFSQVYGQYKENGVVSFCLPGTQGVVLIHLPDLMTGY